MTRAEGRGFHDAVAGATVAAFRKAELELPEDVLSALTRARAFETDPVARSELDNILENITVARRLRVPLCQDTGVPIIYLTLPPHLPLSREILEGVEDGVRRATVEVPLRPNVVDPCTRRNTGDNTGQGMPAVHVAPGDRCTITVLPKGAGSENVSRSTMLLPGEAEGIERFVVETMLLAGGKPCPPVILGVGIGSTFDGVAALAKKALLLPLEPATAYERFLCDAVNALRIGPMGLGGDTTALAVKVMKAACHTASLPVAVNVQCWAARRATVEVEIP
ncbi:MAG: fumarate hydratase [Methanomicrobiaceae archaeon]|nr:fumarate hydratase [Methanomicrobiaceae archaeon]